MKLRIMLLLALGVAGVGASIAFADEGHGHGSSNGNSCQHTGIAGDVSAPQSFTVTVTRAGEDSNLTPGQVVTVAVGTADQPLRFHGEGCVGTDGTLTIREAELQGGRHSHGGGDGGGTTSTSTTTTSATTTTTTSTTSH